jgi:DNA-binding Lrp family transcriptional regulator
MAGIRTELAIQEASSCPVARASQAVDGPMIDVTWTDNQGESVTEQFTAATSDEFDEFEQVFDYGSRKVYEFERAHGEPCICASIQQSLGPVTSVYARDGELHVTIHASDVAQLRELVRDLRDEFGPVNVEYLVQSRDGHEDAELVPVDVGRLTDRQREVLETAHRKGYFEYPRKANASEVAEELGIEPSTFTEHLAAAQSKLLDELLPRGENGQ